VYFFVNYTLKNSSNIRADKYLKFRNYAETDKNKYYYAKQHTAIIA